MSERMHLNTEHFREDLFRVSSDGTVRLLASRCADCGQVYFPRTTICVACGGTELADTEIGPDAELFSYSRVHMPTLNFKPPYLAGLGLVEGLRVFAPVIDVNEPAVGMKLELKALALGDGSKLGYAFYPRRTV